MTECACETVVKGMGRAETKSGHGSMIEDESKTSCATCCTCEMVLSVACVMPSGVYVAFWSHTGW